MVRDKYHKPSVISRREFIQAGAAFVGLATACASGCGRLLKEDKITIGMFTDVHYADKDTWVNRHYRDSLPKLGRCIDKFNSVKPDFAIHLGDLVDSGESVSVELGYLKRIEREYSKFQGERHYVLGNHDLATFSKGQFVANCGARENYYSFDRGGFHFVILDACYNEDGSDYNAGNFHWTETYIPTVESEWLEADLRATRKPTVVFVHQRLDDEHGSHGVKNAPEVRRIMEQSGKVLAVFQGHDHRGAYSNINGIHYCTLTALVEGSGTQNNAYAVVQIGADRSITIEGFGNQKDRELTPCG